MGETNGARTYVPGHVPEVNLYSHLKDWTTFVPSFTAWYHTGSPMTGDDGVIVKSVTSANAGAQKARMAKTIQDERLFNMLTPDG